MLKMTLDPSELAHQDPRDDRGVTPPRVGAEAAPPAREILELSRPRWIRPLRLAIFLTLISLVATTAFLPELPHRKTLILVTIAAFVGWATNWVAIWFLFHRFLGLPGTGVVPRNKALFFQRLARRMRYLLDESDLLGAVSAKVEAHLRGPEWQALLGDRVDRVLDEVASRVQDLPSVFARDPSLPGRVRAVVSGSLSDFGTSDEHVAARQELRRIGVAKIDALLPDFLRQLEKQIQQELSENLEEMGDLKRLVVSISGTSKKIADAPSTLCHHIEAAIREQIRNEAGVDETIRRAIEGAAKDLRENRDLDPIVEEGLRAGAKALAGQLQKGGLREHARAEILQRVNSQDFHSAIVSTFQARIKEFLNEDLEGRLRSALGTLRDEEIEGRFRDISDMYFLWIELWGGVLGAVGGLTASMLL